MQQQQTQQSQLQQQQQNSPLMYPSPPPSQYPQYPQHPQYGYPLNASPIGLAQLNQQQQLQQHAMIQLQQQQNMMFPQQPQQQMRNPIFFQQQPQQQMPQPQQQSQPQQFQLAQKQQQQQLLLMQQFPQQSLKQAQQQYDLGFLQDNGDFDQESIKLGYDDIDKPQDNSYGMESCMFCGKPVNTKNQDPYNSITDRRFPVHTTCSQNNDTNTEVQSFLSNNPPVPFVKILPQSTSPFEELLNPRLPEVLAVQWDIFHPISAQRLFAFEKIVPIFQTLPSGEKTAFWRISNPRAEFLETSQVAIPFFRARNVLTIHYSKEIYSCEFQWELHPQSIHERQINLLVNPQATPFDMISIGIGSTNGSSLNSQMTNLFSHVDYQAAPFIELLTLTIRIPEQQNQQIDYFQQSQQLQSQPHLHLKALSRPQPQTSSLLMDKLSRRTCSSKPSQYQYSYSVDASMNNSPRTTLPSRSEQLDDSGYDLQLNGDNSNHQQQQQQPQEMKTFKDIAGGILQLSKTNTGSHQLQQIFKSCSTNEIDQAISEIIEELPRLVIDPYANYMFQSLVQVCSPQQRKQLLQKIAPELATLVQDKKGTHSLQTFIALIKSRDEFDLVVSNISNQITELSQHQNATHFVQKVTACFPLDTLDCLLEAVTKDIVNFGNNQHSLCVLKVLMTKIAESNESDQIDILISLLAVNNEELIQNPYGNYAIQHAYDCFKEERCQRITQKLFEKLPHYSFQKYSSNVIEKCISVYCKDFYLRAIQLILEKRCIGEFMKIQYGNYILQKLLVKSAGQQCNVDLVNGIKQNLPSIPHSKFKAKWQGFLDDRITASHLAFQQQDPNSPSESYHQQGTDNNNNINLARSHNNTPTSNSGVGQSYFASKHRLKQKSTDRKSNFSDSYQTDDDSQPQDAPGGGFQKTSKSKYAYNNNNNHNNNSYY